VNAISHSRASVAPAFLTTPQNARCNEGFSGSNAISSAILLWDRIGSEHCWNGNGGGGNADCVRGRVPAAARGTADRGNLPTSRLHRATAATRWRFENQPSRQGVPCTAQVNKQVPSDRGTPLHSHVRCPVTDVMTAHRRRSTRAGQGQTEIPSLLWKIPHRTTLGFSKQNHA
jgi:hypothetical protein